MYIASNADYVNLCDSISKTVDSISLAFGQKLRSMKNGNNMMTIHTLLITMVTESKTAWIGPAFDYQSLLSIWRKALLVLHMKCPHVLKQQSDAMIDDVASLSPEKSSTLSSPQITVPEFNMSLQILLEVLRQLSIPTPICRLTQDGDSAIIAVGNALAIMPSVEGQHPWFLADGSTSYAS
jgi:hypothetical protein